MNRWVVGLTVALAALGACEVWGGEPGAIVSRLDTERRQAMVEADSAALDTLLADGCVYTHSTGLVQTKAELIAMLVSGVVNYVSYEVVGVGVHAYAATAVVTGRQVIQLVVRGKPVTSVSRFTAAWTRMNDDWKCVAYQSTPIPEAKEGQ